MVDGFSHEGLRVLLREEGVSIQVIKTWKRSNDPDFEAKKNRFLEVYDIADGNAERKLLGAMPNGSFSVTSSVPIFVVCPQDL